MRSIHRAVFEETLNFYSLQQRRGFAGSIAFAGISVEVTLRMQPRLAERILGHPPGRLVYSFLLGQPGLPLQNLLPTFPYLLALSA